MKHITEEMKLETEWYKEAENVKYNDLGAFIKKLMTEYKHDYGTIVKAICAGMMATCHTMNSGKQGGITGFQASCLMWELIRRFNLKNNVCGAKLVDYDKMLYPQYEDEFEKVISEDAWKEIQKQANENLITSTMASSRVISHWKSIVDGKVPFGYKVMREESK